LERCFGGSGEQIPCACPVEDDVGRPGQYGLVVRSEGGDDEDRMGAIGMCRGLADGQRADAEGWVAAQDGELIEQGWALGSRFENGPR
jgi:hypothetical protein